MTTQPFYALPLEEVFISLKSLPDGLTTAEAEKRLIEYGRNELPEKRPDPALKLFLSQFHSPLMYIMVVATAISFLVNNMVEGVFISIVMVSNAIVGFWQEHKANKSLKALRGVIRLYARVVRDNEEQEIDAADLVPGDLLLLRLGDKVPADGPFIASKNLQNSQ